MSKEKNHAKEHIKDLGIIAGGTVAGAGAAYALSRGIRSKYGKTLERIDPKDRLKYLAPAIGALGTASAIAHMQQKAHSYNEKKASVYLENV